MSDAVPDRVRLGQFEVDLRAGEVCAEGRTVRLQEQPFQILMMLIERDGGIVTREEIQKKLWPNDTIVEFDNSINAAIKKLRQALGDSADQPRYIETVARRGYRLLESVGPVGVTDSDGLVSPRESSAANASWGATGRADISSDPSALIAKQVSHYRVLKVIGGGGMGMVYKAEDLKLGRQVALKFLPEELKWDAIALQRFEREARAASSLDHPNICTIYEVEEHEHRPFIVMQLLQGVTLRDRLGSLSDEGKTLALDELFDIAIQICQGLQAADDKGIIHRDIKPANIFLTAAGPVKILDFGLAKVVDATRAGGELSQPATSGPAAGVQPAKLVPDDETLTCLGVAVGTAGYMSPEQIRGEKLDVRTDIFSFGLVLYEMATGKRAFGPGPIATVHASILNNSPTDVLTLRPELPPRMREIITRCLQKDRNQRYQHASELRDDLTELQRETTADLQEKSRAAADEGTAAVAPPVPARFVSKRALWTRRMVVAASAILLAALAVVAYKHWRVPVTVEANASIAVLPFTDLSPGKDQEYFSDGLTEQLINNLARIPGLKVMSRSSSFQFKGKAVDPAVVGRKLNVANILEGSVSREGDRLRITAELTKAADGYQLWSHNYDRQLSDVFAVQDEIARAVAEELQLKLTATNGSPLPASAATSPAAYEAFLQGRYFARRHQPGDWQKALEYADQATKLAPDYAPGWALRSEILSELSLQGLIDNVDGYRKARASAQTAIALDPALADGYLALGLIQMNYDWDWRGAEGTLRKAAEAAPGKASVYLNLASLAELLGRFDEALALEKQSISLDPERLRGYRTLGTTLYNAGRYEEAAAALQKALELNPQIPLTHYYRGAVMLAQGHAQQALPEMQQEQFEPFRFMGEAVVYDALGRQQDSDAALQELITKHQKDSAYQIADVYAYRKDPDKAFLWLDRAYEQRDSALPNVKIDPLLNNLHHDPRYTAMLNKLGL